MCHVVCCDGLLNYFADFNQICTPRAALLKDRIANITTLFVKKILIFYKTRTKS